MSILETGQGQLEALRPRVYLAGPDVFLSDAVVHGTCKKELCSRYGFEGVFPIDAEVRIEQGRKEEIGLHISATNETIIKGCQLLIANMTPFRGPSADVGTAYEMGFARGIGLPVFAYTNTKALFTDRTTLALKNQVERAPDGVLRDENSMAIEEWGLVDNLMLDGCIHGGGGALVTDETAESDRYRELGAFEECLRRAREFWDIRTGAR